MTRNKEALLFTLRNAQLSEEIAHDERKKAIQRIIERRQELRDINDKKYELSKQEHTESRTRLRATMKSKRLKEVTDHLDRYILHGIIRNEANLLINIVNSNCAINQESSYLENEWKDYLEGLPPVISCGDRDIKRLNKHNNISSNTSAVQAFLIKALSKNGNHVNQNFNDQIHIITSPLPEFEMSRDIVNRYNKSQPSKQRTGLLSKFLNHSLQSKAMGHSNKGNYNANGSGNLPSNYVLLPGHYDSNSELGAALINDSTPGPNHFARMADSILVTGPSREEIENLVDKANRKSLNSDTKQGTDGTILTEYLEPRLILLTKALSDVDSNILPAFCFPSGVETTVFRSSRSRQNSLSVAPTSSVVNPNNSSSLSPNKYPTTSATNNNRNPFPGIGKFSSPSSRRYSFILTGHTITRFGVCYLVKSVFNFPHYSMQVQADYCICIITRFPFFPYLFNLLDQFEHLSGCWELSEPLHPHEEGFPIHADLAPIDDLARRFNGLIVPRFNGITTEEELLDVHSTVRIPLSSYNQTHKTRLNLELNRAMYQTFYTSLTMNTNATTSIDNNSKLRPLTSPNDEQEQEREKEMTFHILLWALPILLKYLPLEQIVTALGCAMTEMHIVVQCADVSVMSACVLALLNLLAPFKWVGPIIVTLPSTTIDPSANFIDYLESSPSYRRCPNPSRKLRSAPGPSHHPPLRPVQAQEGRICPIPGPHRGRLRHLQRAANTPEVKAYRRLETFRKIHFKSV